MIEQPFQKTTCICCKKWIEALGLHYDEATSAHWIDTLPAMKGEEVMRGDEFVVTAAMTMQAEEALGLCEGITLDEDELQ